MTAQLIDQQVGADRRLFLKIDGLPYAYFQDGDRSLPTYSGITSLPALEVLTGGAQSIDLKSYTPGLAAMSFGLKNVFDSTGARVPGTNLPNTVYLFAQEFAPGRWQHADSSQTWVAQNSQDQIDAGAVTITCIEDVSDQGFNALGGTAYIGSETFTYGGATGLAFTTCVKGKFPAHASGAMDTEVFGQTYQTPVDETTLPGENGAAILISDVPYSHVGRGVSLWVAMWDPDASSGAGAYETEAQASLLWAGQIDDKITYQQSTGQFVLSCSSVLSMLEKNIVRHTPEHELVGMNLKGPRGLKCNLVEQTTDNIFLDTTHESNAVNFTPGLYLTARDVLIQFQKDLRTTIAAGSYDTDNIKISFNPDGTPLEFYFDTTSGSDSRIYFQTSKGEPFLPFLALGIYDKMDAFIEEADGKVTYSIDAINEPFHPCHNDYNGERLYYDVKPLNSTRPLFADQSPDSSITRAYLAIDDARNSKTENASSTGDNSSPTKGDKKSYITAYNNSDTADGIFYHYATLSPTPVNIPYSQFDFVSGKRNKIKNVLVQESDVVEGTAGFHVGIFEWWLYVILSTGDTDYNGTTYDKLPAPYGLGIHEDLVDAQSFLDADKFVPSAFGTPGPRVYPKEISFLKAFLEDCKLFGVALVWNNGKITLRRITSFGSQISKYTETLDASTGSQLIELAEVSQTMDNVINSWSVMVDYNNATGKYQGKPIVINDQDSQDILKLTSSVSINNNFMLGVGTNKADATVKLTNLFAQYRDLYRFPWWKMSVTLGPVSLSKVFAGDIVRYQDSNLPDPYGSGLMTLDALAIVLGVSPNWAKWEGTATLLLFSRYDALDLRPWAPAALVNIAGVNGGWTGLVITVLANGYGDSGDEDDSAAFSVNDEVLIVETDPTDPTAPVVLGPHTVTAVSATTITVDAIPGGGWAPLKEHRVIAADWQAKATGQDDRGTWQANTTGGLLNTDRAQRYS